MSREDLELVKDVFSQWNAGERTVPEERMHPEVELISRGIMEGRPLRGREGVLSWLREIDEQFDEWRLEIEDWRESRDFVVGLGRIHMHGRESGIPFDQPLGILLEFSDGLLIRLETFVEDPADALTAAGLSE